MLKLTLADSYGEYNLNSQQEFGSGWQVHAGVIGMGLPPVQGQFLQGAGDGAAFRGSRVLTRDLDLPLSYLAPRGLSEDLKRDKLIQEMDRMSRMMSGEMKLTAVDTRGVSWYLIVYRVGGGNYVFGQDTTGEGEMEMVVTVRAADPYWTAVVPKTAEVVQRTEKIGLIGTGKAATNLRLAPSQALGRIRIDNSGGSADAYPVWYVHGPGSVFRAVSPKGEVFQWNGTLGAAGTLTIDTRTGVVKDGADVNRYKEMAPAPRFWAVPPGTVEVVASIGDPGPTTRIACHWRPRKWAVL